MASNPTVFFDVSAGGQPLGRIEMVSIDTVDHHLSALGHSSSLTVLHLDDQAALQVLAAPVWIS